MSGKRVDIITTWAEAAEALGLSYRDLKALHRDYLESDLPMPIEVRGRRILTSADALQEWTDKRALRAAGQKN
jgi:hypothetical protein